MRELRQINRYVLRHWPAFSAGLLLMAVAVGTSIYSPFLIRHAVDAIEQGTASRSYLLLSALGIVGVALLGGAATFGQRVLMLGASRQIEYEMRNDFFRHLEKLPLSFYHSVQTGDLMTRATSDLGAVREYIGAGFMHGGRTLILLTGTLAVMVTLNPRLTLCFVLLAPAVSITFAVLLGKIHQRYEAVQEKFSDISAKAQENFAGIRVVKGYAKEEVEISDFRRLNAEFIDLNMRLAKVDAPLFPAMSLLFGLGYVAILLVGGREVMANRLSIGELVQFMVYMGLTSWPLIAMGWVANLVQRAITSWRRLDEILRVAPAIADTQTDWTQTILGGDIEFRQVTLQYPDGTVALEGVNLTIPAGTTCALVGPTGGGKSSVANLIPRLFDVTSGQVLIGGVEVRQIPLAVLRAKIGMVPQETFLFSDTLAENVAFGVPQVDLERIKWAAEISQLGKDVADFPEGFHTLVGERGVTLSGGQKQRTALARAVIRDPKILILDDALSSVDTYTEANILEGLRGVMAGRTSILIAHRVSTVRSADQIVVIDSGQVVERGTHAELLERGGLYADMERKQRLSQELEDDGAALAGG